MSFGNNIQQLRKEKGMSQEQLAAELAVSRQAISKWELGESMPDTENLIKLANLFEVTLDDMVKKDGQCETVASEHNQSENTTEKKGYFVILIITLFICLGSAVWKPIWISFLFIPFCYLLYAVISKGSDKK